MNTKKYIGLILAGGSNRRFPYPKGLIKTPEGVSLITHNGRLLGEFFEEVLLSTNTPEVYFPQGLPMVGDIFPERGPLGGIFSTLIATGAEGVFVLACDMPSVKREIIEIILKHDRDDIEAVVCEFAGKVHPLLGLYKRVILPVAEELLRQGPVSMIDFLKALNAAIIEEEQIQEIDPEGQSFRNINTPEDLEDFLENRP